MALNQLPLKGVRADAAGKSGKSLELTVDMPCGVGDNGRMKRPLFNMMKDNYANTVLSVLVPTKKTVESDCRAENNLKHT